MVLEQLFLGPQLALPLLPQLPFEEESIVQHKEEEVLEKEENFVKVEMEMRL